MFWKDEPFEPVPLPVLFLRSPLKTSIKVVHNLLTDLRGPSRPHNPAIVVVCISDTHAQTKAIPEGDVLIHAGDLTNAGTQKDIQHQIDWLNGLPHKFKICIAGNHDTWLDPRSRQRLQKSGFGPETLDWKDVIYLQHSSVSLYFPTHAGRRLEVYGAPQIPACGGPEFAFQYPRGQDAWTETIPKDTDVLVTHTPPIFHRDLPTGRGCEHLLRELWRVKPTLHVFGHIHAGRGQETLFFDGAQSAYERASTRSDGWLHGLLDIVLWLSLARVLFYGVLGFLWSTAWGGRQESTRLVNASLTYRNTGQLRNGAQVVRI
ncbi:metallophosphoesterase domain-containing protein [Myriangium duriaei CBS 260.36]|uniref:Metallophosphoesterase domain-containing protein n=1 Tax=Myriangium duriaei CBS 260.36 TaxID=1168546 RepID=A0A9P4J2F0_9PEZI|nr:metallophosphoesterase domain-containing protein [Myriangium duriaei CBS 260.36]